MPNSHWSIQTQWPPDARHVGDARRFVADRLEADDLGGLADVSSLIVSELASNAVQHAHSAFRVTVERQRGCILLEVHDQAAGTVTIPDQDFLSSGGRGLSLVRSLSDAWGVTPHPGGGKSVWASLSTRDLVRE